MVKQGYKQTEIGVIPEDWEVKPFKEVTRLITCGIAATPHYVNESLGKTFLSSTNVKKGKIDYDNVKYIPLKLHNQLYKNNPPEKGDLLYTRVGAVIGEAAVINVDYEFSIYVSLTLIKEKKAILNNYYLMHLLNSTKYENLAYNTVLLGGGVGNLNVNVVREFPIILPPLAEQEAIASALSDADAWVERLEQLIAKKRLIKQGAMQTLLTPQENWEVKKLGEMVSLITKGTTPTSVGFDFTESGINFIKVESITKNGQIEKDKIAFISERCNDVLSRSQIKENDILFSIAGALGRVAIVKKEIVPANTNQALGIIRLKENTISKEFLYYFFNTSEFQQMLNTISVTGAQPNLSLQNLNEFDISFPFLSEQERIATILSDMDAELEALAKQLGKARQIKQGMMQELLTGRVRLV